MDLQLLLPHVSVIYSSSGSNLNFEQGVSRALCCVKNVLLHLGEEETCDLRAVGHQELLVDLTLPAGRTEMEIRYDLAD